ncbi:MAG: PspC domain-containing protein [Verrucomicrobiia bacterium]
MLKRSHNSMIAGVCGGIAEWLGWPAQRVRIVYILLSVLSAGFPSVLVYLALWYLMPPAESSN